MTLQEGVGPSAGKNKQVGRVTSSAQSALESATFMPLLRPELARGAAVALTFRSARWESAPNA